MYCVYCIAKKCYIIWDTTGEQNFTAITVVNFSIIGKVWSTLGPGKIKAEESYKFIGQPSTTNSLRFKHSNIIFRIVVPSANARVKSYGESQVWYNLLFITAATTTSLRITNQISEVSWRHLIKNHCSNEWKEEYDTHLSTRKYPIITDIEGGTPPNNMAI